MGFQMANSGGFRCQLSDAAKSPVIFFASVWDGHRASKVSMIRQGQAAGWPEQATVLVMDSRSSHYWHNRSETAEQMA